MEKTAEVEVPEPEYLPKDRYGGANFYAAKKTVAQGMMDVALITANANQLRFILEYNQTSPSFNIAIALIIISLILQVVVGICLIFKGRCDLKGDKKFKEANTMNNYIVVGVFIITIVNVFVAAFSTGPPPLPKIPENVCVSIPPSHFTNLCTMHLYWTLFSMTFYRRQNQVCSSGNWFVLSPHLLNSSK